MSDSVPVLVLSPRRLIPRGGEDLVVPASVSDVLAWADRLDARTGSHPVALNPVPGATVPYDEAPALFADRDVTAPGSETVLYGCIALERWGALRVAHLATTDGLASQPVRPIVHSAGLELAAPMAYPDGAPRLSADMVRATAPALATGVASLRAAVEALLRYGPAWALQSFLREASQRDRSGFYGRPASHFFGDGLPASVSALLMSASQRPVREAAIAALGRSGCQRGSP